MAAPYLKIQLANSSLAGAGSFALTRPLVRAVGLGVPRPPCLSPAVLTSCISATPSSCLAAVPPLCSHRTWVWGCLSCFWHSCVFDIGHSLCCDLEITILEGSKPTGFKNSKGPAHAAEGACPCFKLHASERLWMPGHPQRGVKLQSHLQVKRTGGGSFGSPTALHAGALGRAECFFRGTAGTRRPAGCAPGSELLTAGLPACTNRSLQGFCPNAGANRGTTKVHHSFAVSPVPPGHRMRPRLLAISV